MLICGPSWRKVVSARVILALGAIAHAAVLRACDLRSERISVCACGGALH